MEKYLKIGEQYIEWIALGLGGLFLLGMAYYYVLSAPVMQPVKIGAQPKALSPSDIDHEINATVAAPLKHDVDSRVGVEFKIPEVKAELAKGFQFDIPAPKATQIAGPIKASTGGIKTAVVAVTIPKALPPAEPVKDPASPDVAAVSMGVSMLDIPPASPPLILATDPAAAAAPPPPVPPAPGAVPATDSVWLSASFRVKSAGIAAAFKDAHIPPELAHTSFLRVVVEREEQLPDGKWGSPVVIPHPIGHPLPELPAETKPMDDKIAYKTWVSVSANELDLMQPAFYTVTTPGSDAWYPPGGPKPDPAAAPAALPAPAPAAPFPVMPATVRPAVPASEGARPVPGVAPRRAPPAAPPAPPMAPGAAPGVAPAAVPGTYPPSSAAAAFGNAAGATGSIFNIPGDPAPAAPAATPTLGATGAPAADLTPVEPGEFDPAQTPDAQIIIHDTSVKPSHTYRYRVAYAIKNPLFNYNIGAEKDRSVLAVWSQPGVWTNEITTPSRYTFFVKRVDRNLKDESLSTATFDLFGKVEGKLKPILNQAVNSGGAIGQTGWTVVDIRFDPRLKFPNNRYVLVADPNGKVYRRDEDHDKQNPDYDNLKNLANNAAAAGN